MLKSAARLCDLQLLCLPDTMCLHTYLDIFTYRSPMFYSFEGTDRTHHLCGSLLFHVPDTGMERVLNPPVGLFVAHMLTLCPVALLTLLVLEAFFFFFW